MKAPDSVLGGSCSPCCHESLNDCHVRKPFQMVYSSEESPATPRTISFLLCFSFLLLVFLSHCFTSWYTKITFHGSLLWKAARQCYPIHINPASPTPRCLLSQCKYSWKKRKKRRKQKGETPKRTNQKKTCSKAGLWQKRILSADTKCFE